MKIKPKKKFFRKMDVLETIMFIIITLYVFSMLLVLFYALLTSLKHFMDFERGNKLFGLPSTDKQYQYNRPLVVFGMQFGNYLDVFTRFTVDASKAGGGVRPVYFVEMLWNSLLYSVAMSAGSILLQVMAAYACAKYDFKLKNFIYGFVILNMTIPIVGTLASKVDIATSLGLKGNLLGLMVLNCSYTGMYFLVFYGAFKSVSWGYAEAAQIDGAGHLRIFVEIMVPLIRATIFAVFILQFIAHYNEYYTPMIFWPDRPTIAYGLFMFQSNVETGVSAPLKCASALVSAIPMMALFIAFRNIIMGNVSVGGLKG